MTNLLLLVPTKPHRIHILISLLRVHSTGQWHHTVDVRLLGSSYCMRVASQSSTFFVQMREVIERKRKPTLLSVITGTSQPLSSPGAG